jgi:hypothetical protein
MPFDRGQLRLERFQAQVTYHAAYAFWNLRGVLAERWAHGPIFGATNEVPQQVTLLPARGEEGTDASLQAAYGLRASGVIGEGPKSTAEAQKIASDFIDDALTALNPKRVVKVEVSLFGLYPLDDQAEASRRLRSIFYGDSEALTRVLPPTVRNQREKWHSAVDFIVPETDEGTGLSVVIGPVGPPHRGSFFSVPNADRDTRWWMGFRVDRRRVEERGIRDPGVALSRIMSGVLEEYEHVAGTVLREILP